jgi:cytidyltransferase-like protein
MLHLTSKNVIVIGSFDCLSTEHLKLIKKARKMAYEGKVIVMLYDDFTSYQIDKKFPVQTTEQRRKNLHYFVDDIQTIMDKEKMSDKLQSVIDFNDKPIAFVGYIEDGKDFIGRDILRSNGVMCKFVYKDKI